MGHPVLWKLVRSWRMSIVWLLNPNIYRYTASPVGGSLTTTCTYYNTWYGTWSYVSTSCVCMHICISLRAIIVFSEILYLLIVSSTYCLTPAPILSNANTPVANQYMGGQTNFTCSNGYQSSGGSYPPYYTCMNYSLSQGEWSSITYTCNRMLS